MPVDQWRFLASDMSGSVFNFGLEFAFRSLHFGEAPFIPLSRKC